MHDQIAEGNKAATRWTLTGTQRADSLGVTSSGRTGRLTATTIDILENDMFVEHWAEVGVAHFLQQLAA